MDNQQCLSSKVLVFMRPVPDHGCYSQSLHADTGMKHWAICLAQQSLGNWGWELIGFSHRRAMEEDHYTIVHDEVGGICCIMMHQSSIDINPYQSSTYNSQSTTLSLKEGNLVHFDDHLTLGGIACALSHRLALQRHSNASGFWQSGYSTSEGMDFG